MTVAAKAATTGSCFGEDQVWPPGFRFHPTDEELVLYYLKRKICRRKLKLDIIRETDVYKWDPEELPAKSILKSGDRQWFFFSPRDRKYPNAARSNRATGHGYWKATGKDRTVTCNSRTVGVKKTLVFYRGRAPIGERTDWVMHEYTLDEEELKRCQNVKDYYALYKLYKKSGPGPKNGEQYGAPFKEEEWADEEYASKAVDVITPVKQPNEAFPDDVEKAKNQIQSPLNDIEEFMRQFAAEPALPQPQAHFDNILPRLAGEEEIQSTLLDTSPRDVLLPKPVEVVHDHASFELSQSPTSRLQLQEAPEDASVSDQFEQIPQICEEDFLEIDDLTSNVEKPVENGLQFNDWDGLGEFDLYHDAAMFLQDIGPIEQGIVPFSYTENMINQVSYPLEPQLQHQSNTNHMDQELQFQLNGTGVDEQLQLQSNAFGNNQQVQSQLNTIGDNQPQLNAFEDGILNQVGYQFHSSANNMMDQQLLPNSTVDQVDYHLPFQSFGNEMERQLQMDQINGSIWINDQSGDVFTPSGSNLGNASSSSGLVYNGNNQDEGDKKGEGASRFSTAMWSFVDSIPTTPASASESPSVNRAFERMSSFSRLRMNVRNTNALIVNGGTTARRRSRSKGFFFFSILGALCAILWFLIGMVRVVRSSISS
ncbi:hypothetical protein E1A91_D05G265500v1 [Gossypium mustelinum]|uniref:NAC domain-containing protein n=1 Tax=Gossypium mustelinum TaxID=34275 RepID=A0A5D2V168_GOSMU|nr:hypothetical protein E1A91_D05G265500v1 [Gossypium mustelinum]